VFPICVAVPVADYAAVSDLRLVAILEAIWVVFAIAICGAVVVGMVASWHAR
jgi:hypothetical protein